MRYSKLFKSEISYKFLIFLLLSLMIFFVVSKIIYQFISYHEDIDLTKERLENLIIKEKGSFLNNLNYPIYSFININLLDNQIKQIVPRQIIEKSSEEMIAFDLKVENDFNKLNKLEIKPVELLYSNLKIYNDQGEYKLLINCNNFKSEEVKYLFITEEFNILNDNKKSFFYFKRKSY